MVSVDTAPEVRVSAPAGDRASRLATILAEVTEVLEAMPTGLAEARQFVNSRLWHSPRPEEIQILVGMTGRSGEGSRRASARRLIALRLLADREVKSFWTSSLDDPYGILGRADVLRWTLDEIREERDRLEGRSEDVPGADRGDREFCAQVARTLSPKTDDLIAAMVIAPSLARLAQIDREADRRAIFPSLSDREAEILRPAPEGGREAPSTLRLAALEVAAARWTFLEELRAWDALAPPPPAERAEQPVQVEQSVQAKESVQAEGLADEAPVAAASLDPDQDSERALDARMISTPSSEPSAHSEVPFNETVIAVPAKQPFNGKESELDGESIPDLTDDPSAPPADDYDDGPTMGDQGDDERARLRLRFHEQHELVFRVVGDRLQSLQSAARAMRDKELIEPLIALRQGLVASFWQLAAHAEGRSREDGSVGGAGRTSDTSKDGTDGSSTNQSHEEQVIAGIFEAAAHADPAKGATSQPSPLAQEKARKRRRAIGLGFAALLVMGIAEVVKLSLPPPGPAPITFTATDAGGIIPLDSTESIGDMLYARVPESWLSLPSGDRSHQLEALGRLAQARGFAAVFLVDPSGEPAGKWLAKRGVTFLSSPPRS